MKVSARVGAALLGVIVTIIAAAMVLGVLVMWETHRDKPRCSASVSMNNQAEISRALAMYENSRERYPGYAQVLPGTNREVSWAVAILSQLGRRDIYETYMDGTTRPDVRRLEVMSAPGDYIERNSREPDCTYVVNGGLPDSAAQDSIASGIFHDHRPAIREPVYVNFDDIARRDGTTQTLLLGENILSRYWTDTEERLICFLWEPGSTVQPINARNRLDWGDVAIAMSNNDARLNSPCLGGVVVTFADGHQQFLKKTITLDVYNRLCTPDGSVLGQKLLAMSDFNF